MQKACREIRLSWILHLMHGNQQHQQKDLTVSLAETFPILLQLLFPPKLLDHVFAEKYFYRSIDWSRSRSGNNWRLLYMKNQNYFPSFHKSGKCNYNSYYYTLRRQNL